MKVPTYPIHLEIESTNRCNLACVMCPHKIMKRKQQDMPWDIFTRIIDQARNQAKSSYLHMIGEPLLNEAIVEMINYTSYAGISTSISTNCMFLDEELSNELLDSRLNEIVLCLDAYDKDAYETIRLGGDYDRVKQVVDQFIEMRQKHSSSTMKVLVQLIHMKANDQFVESLSDEYTRKLKGIGHVWIKQYSRFAGYVPDLNVETTKPRRFSCSKPRTHMAFQSDGDCVLCCRDFEKMTVMGNIQDASLLKLWHSDAYNKYRLQFDRQKWDGNPLCCDC